MSASETNPTQTGPAAPATEAGALTLGYGAALDSYDRCDCPGLEVHARKLSEGTHAPIENLSGVEAAPWPTGA